MLLYSVIRDSMGHRQNHKNTTNSIYRLSYVSTGNPNPKFLGYIHLDVHNFKLLLEFCDVTRTERQSGKVVRLSVKLQQT